MSLHKLNETAPLAWRNLNVGNLAETLEEGTQFIFSDISREATDEDGGVVWVSKLVHGLRCAVVTHWRSAHGVHSDRATGLYVHAGGASGTTALVFWRRGRDAHWAIAAVDTLHFG